jgi:hypothetical protein
MNLGKIHLETAAAIIAISFVIALLIASLLRLRRYSWRIVFIAAEPQLTASDRGLDAHESQIPFPTLDAVLHRVRPIAIHGASG